MLKKLYYSFKLIPKLGYWNVGYILWYRFSTKIGLRKKMFNIEKPIVGNFFIKTNIDVNYPNEWKEQSIIKADEIISGKFTYFSFHKFQLQSIPDWFYNPFENKRHQQQIKHWTEISDFGEGDIKIIWELSRFDWLTDLGRAYKITGDYKYLNIINTLLNSWSESNPLNQGPNWKCGQETSFRLMKLLTTAFILDQSNKPSKSLLDWVYQHVKRIKGNIYYGIAQDNNHGSSEAIGLYIGSAWLIKNKYKHTSLLKWKLKGRRLLEGRVENLIQKDGSFSQRSMNYHRVMVDTMSFCLHKMQLLKEEPFSKEIVNKLIALGEWQYKMTFGKDGDAPNFGSNDGARIENLHSNDYRDFRPSTQLFFALLTQQRVNNDISIDEAMYWRCGKESLKFPLRNIALPKNEILDEHILIIRNERAKIFLKLPDDTFRPGNDAFHIDLWVDGKPQLIDTGTYSYNAGQLTDIFKSISSHNTVQFNNGEPMPKISRFLNGEWLRCKEIGNIEVNNEYVKWKGNYIDYKKNKHEREIILNKSSLFIVDKISGNKPATQRFYIDKDHSLTNMKSAINANASLYYLEKHNVLLLENTENFTINFSWN